METDNFENWEYENDNLESTDTDNITSLDDRIDWFEMGDDQSGSIPWIIQFVIIMIAFVLLFRF